MKTNRLLMTLWDYFLMTVGSVIFCMAWTSFLIPNGLASGGLTGLCTIIQYGTGIPVGLTYPIINIVLLVLGFLSLGRAFGFKTIYVIAVTSLLFDILPEIFECVYKTALIIGSIIADVQNTKFHTHNLKVNFYSFKISQSIAKVN